MSHPVPSLSSPSTFLCHYKRAPYRSVSIVTERRRNNDGTQLKPSYLIGDSCLSATAISHTFCFRHFRPENQQSCISNQTESSITSTQFPHSQKSSADSPPGRRKTAGEFSQSGVSNQCIGVASGVGTTGGATDFEGGWVIKNSPDLIYYFLKRAHFPFTKNRFPLKRWEVRQFLEGGGGISLPRFS